MSPQRFRILPLLLLTPVILSLGLVLFFFVTSPASASYLFGPTPAPTQENLWGYADVPKPTHTPPPTALPAEPPTPPATEAQPVVAMELVDENTSRLQDVQTSPQMVAPATGGGKYILVDISEQHMYVYEGDALIYSFVASTGINNATRVGTFAVQSKIPNAYGSTWDIWMPNWLGIYWSGGLENGIHALPILPNGAILWEGFLGRPVSYGCVVLGTYESQLLYEWAEIGTPVEIQW
ncbi:MAG TPA: L,D-transpeptidase [Anaerolineales bacterium]|nr:L,D-transpeptidase [Anaerolineales bacterium]